MSSSFAEEAERRVVRVPIGSASFMVAFLFRVPNRHRNKRGLAVAEGNERACSPVARVILVVLWTVQIHCRRASRGTGLAAMYDTASTVEINRAPGFSLCPDTFFVPRWGGWTRLLSSALKRIALVA